MKAVASFLAILALFLCWYHDLSSLLTNKAKAVVIRTPILVVAKESEKPSSALSLDVKSGTSSSSRHFYVGDDAQLGALYGDSNNTFHGVQARSFESWSENVELPCFPPRRQTHLKNFKRGFLYLKPLKTGSSTAAGVNLRLARNEAQRRNATFPICDSLNDHTLACKSVPKRNVTNSFLWSTVRDPIDRYVSSFFYFYVSGFNVEPTDENFINIIRTKTMGQGICSHYLDRLATEKYEYGVSDPIHFVNAIFEQYNVVGVTERMDESLVVLAMLLRVPLADVLYLSSKTSGDYGLVYEGCQFLQKSVVSPGMQEFFQTPEFQDCVKVDHIIHQVANRSLDLTIERIGHAEFHKQLYRFKEAKRVAADRCSQNVRYPCDSKGQPQEPNDCLYKDSGCGYKCLDKVATELNLWQVTTK